ncbi:LysR family cyn operon transcriptional activator [Pontibacter ummariensis]|uniref:LysR family transcriptional regulator, cyn operon transcriptional activator n=1 Tax=Pontibacter ummariensis TaxID=1610492 RepID=A0A239L872_9BACT|nr:LysR substrate-binding domain-containing protein [Pontibacter ummariensis]PRY04283.1 LysR family cyn operon transcriptional activator [Pontibacter ummariensis]SNT25724.1 LysR family transcriptional regulator, cyn operon transcriptional activator [Pontibacter ummariensis]
MELRQLRYFLRAKELLNFTEAAHSLHISQSTLSQQIKQLEEELNTPLFNRIGKRVTLTEAGELFATYASQSVNKANEGLLLLKDLNELNVGTISIGVTYGLRSILTQAVVRFASEFPRINFRVVYGTSEGLMEELNELELDLILVFNETTKAQHLKYQPLFDSPVTFVTSLTSRLSGKKSITLEEISQLPLVISTKGDSTSHFIIKAFDRSGLSPKISIEVNDIPTILDLVKSGNWHGILMQTSVKGEGLYSIPIKGRGMVRTAMIISLKEAYEKQAVKRFCNLLTEDIIRLQGVK